MKRLFHSKITVFTAFTLLCLSAVAADDKKPDAAADAQSEEMKKMAELTGPGPEHKVLDVLAGTWMVTTKFWMAGADAPPMETKGTSVKKWILGGRFIQEDFDGDMMGMKFTGLGMTGYDKMKKKYVGTWMDSMGTGIASNEGDADAEKKVLTLKGVMDDAMTGERNKPVKYVLHITGKDKHSLEIHDLTLGDKSKIGEITYVRK